MFPTKLKGKRKKKKPPAGKYAEGLFDIWMFVKSKMHERPRVNQILICMLGNEMYNLGTALCLFYISIKMNSFVYADTHITLVALQVRKKRDARGCCCLTLPSTLLWHGHVAVLQSESAALLCAVNPSNRSKHPTARNEQQLAVYLQFISAVFKNHTAPRVKLCVGCFYYFVLNTAFRSHWWLDTAMLTVLNHI